MENVQIFSGSNALARQEAFQRAVDQWLGDKAKDPYAREILFMDDRSGEVPPIDKFFTVIDTPSFFAERKAICLKNFDQTKAAELEHLVPRLLKEIDPETGIFIDAGSLDQRSKWIKQLVKVFKPQKFENPKPWELPKWIGQRAHHHQFQIDPTTAKFLSEFFLQDCDVINSELEKLRLQFPEATQIDEKMILENFQGSNEGNVFNCLNAFGLLDKQNFQKEFQKLNQNQFDKTLFVANLYAHVSKLIQIKWLVQERASEKEICSQLGINSYLYKINQYPQQCQKRTFPRLERILTRVVEIDEGIKKGNYGYLPDFEMAILAMMF